MRKLFVLVGAAVAACGSSRSSPSNCLSGETSCGGACVNPQSNTQNCGACGHACAAGQLCSGGTCVASGISGTVGDAAFSPAEVVAVRAGPSSCTIANPAPGGTPVTLNVSALAISAASYTGVCGDFSSPFCIQHKSAQSVTVLLAILNAASSAQVVPGTYSVLRNVTTTLPDTNQPGAFYVAVAQSLRTDTSCAPSSGAAPALATGALRLDQVSGSIVTGHVDITFSDGGTLQGDFSAPVCGGVTPDICALAQAGGACAGTRTCL